jgi:hypothetical protein
MEVKAGFVEQTDYEVPAKFNKSINLTHFFSVVSLISLTADPKKIKTS